MNLHSGYPFWLIKDGLPFNFKKLEAPLTTDVLVLGGGISGALVAYYLNKANVDCAVIDARTIGLGSTCASTALLQYEIDTHLCELTDMVGTNNAVRAYQLCTEAIEQIKSIAHTLKFKEFKPTQSLLYAAYKKDAALVKKEFSIRKEHGFKVTYLDSQAVLDDFNFNAPCAILSECGGEINPYAFTHALLKAGITNGLKVFDRTPVANIEHHKTSVTLHTENGITIHAKKIVYATGYEVTEFIKEKIVDLNATYAIVSEQANDTTDFWKNEVLIWNTADPYLYMRTTQDKRMLIGGRDESFFTPAKRDKLIDKKKKQLVNDFNQLFPDIEFKPEFSWAGTFGSTKDGLPFIDTYKKLPNSYFALGFGGNGIVFSVIAAQILTDLITGKKNNDAHIFSFDRL